VGHARALVSSNVEAIGHSYHRVDIAATRISSSGVDTDKSKGAARSLSEALTRARARDFRVP
jgi:hypothetical protein